MTGILGRGPRYWMILVLQFLTFALVTWGLWMLAHRTVLRVELFAERFPKILISYLAFAVLFFLIPGILAALLYAIFRDQRFRCRECGRRLRMPLERGSRSRSMTEPLRIDYICPFGHGKLITEIWVSGESRDKWTPYGDIWEELSARR